MIYLFWIWNNRLHSARCTWWKTSSAHQRICVLEVMLSIHVFKSLLCKISLWSFAFIRCACTVSLLCLLFLSLWMGRRQSTSSNCVALEQMLRQTSRGFLFSPHYSFAFNPFYLVRGRVGCVHGIQPYFAQLVLDLLTVLGRCYYHHTRNCAELLFHLCHKLISAQITNICRCDLCFSSHFNKVPFLVSYYWNKLWENW